MIQLSDKVGQLFCFSISAARARSSSLAQGQLGFFLPFRLLGDRLLNTTGQLFLFRQRAGRCRTHLNQRVFHLLDHQTHQLLRVLRFLQQGVDVGVHDVGKTRKIPIISILIVLVSGIHLWLS